MPRRSLLVPLVLALLVVHVAFAGAAVASTAAQPHGHVPAPGIIAFDQWRDAACPRPSVPDRFSVDRIVVHHTSEPVAWSRDSVPATLRELCHMHVARGFDTIGYHYVVDEWGRVWQGRGPLPDADGHGPAAVVEGAHVAGSNPGALGVAFLGDHDIEPPTAAAVAAAVHLIAWLSDSAGLDPYATTLIESTGVGTALHTGTVEVNVLDGHNHTNETLCPGQHLEVLLEPIRELVSATVHGAIATSEAARAAASVTGDAGGVLDASDVLAAVGHLVVANGVQPAPPVGPVIAIDAPIRPAPPLPSQARHLLAPPLGLLGLMALLALRVLVVPRRARR